MTFEQTIRPRSDGGYDIVTQAPGWRIADRKYASTFMGARFAAWRRRRRIRLAEGWEIAHRAPDVLPPAS